MSTEQGLRIITNNIPRPIVDGWELSPSERAEFDYLDWKAIEDGRDSASFVRYKGELIDLNDFEGTFPPDGRWCYRSDSYFSGIVYRYAPDQVDPTNPDKIDPDYVIVGRYFA